MRTRLEYMYRDASNYKYFESVTLDGPPDTDKQIIKAIIDKFGFESASDPDEPFFMAHAIGLPPAQKKVKTGSAFPTDDDHVWNTLIDARNGDFAPTTKLTVAQLLQNIAGADTDIQKEMIALGWNEQTI